MKGTISKYTQQSYTSSYPIVKYNTEENDLQNMLNQALLRKSTDQILSDIYTQEWCADVDNNAKCKVHCIFKKCLKFANI